MKPSFLNGVRKRTVCIYAFAVTLIFILAVLLIIIKPSYQAAWALGALVLVWIPLMFSLLRIRNVLSQLVKERERASDILERVDRRLLKTSGVTMDIAGTTGRMAPLVRQLASTTNQPPGGLARAVKSGVRALAESAKSSTDSSGASSSFGKIQKVEDLIKKKRRDNKRDLSVLVIADEFTVVAFSEEWNQVLPTPENYIAVLESMRFDLLFVESAWEGNGGSWRYHLVGQSAPRPALVDLVKRCKDKGIPTAFWNKEDPPHFEEFLETASLFDYVFTTESAKIPEYVARLGHDRVHTLGFAVQPAVHNPARIAGVDREGNSVFGGMYFRHKYPERREQMNFLLPAAAKYGLDIYTRDVKEERYRFPKELERHIVGSLPYPQMVAAYHHYKVVLNVNSVPSSESMVARRIFEATACGAAVVSPPTPAIDNYFGKLDGVSQVGNEEEAENQIRALVRSDIYRDRLVHRAQRAIWEGHTYSHRVDKICEVTGLLEPKCDESVSVIISTIRPGSMTHVIANLRRQTVSNLEVVLVAHGVALSPEHLREIEQLETVSSLKVINAPKSQTLGQNLNGAVDASSGNFIVRMDDDDWYGPNYIRDLRNAADFSGADLVGKSASYIYFEDRDMTVRTFATQEHCYTHFVRGATFAGPRETFLKYRFPSLGKSEDSTVLSQIVKDGGLIYAADRFNFVVNRFADKGRHTWTVDDARLFATGEMEFMGSAHDQLAL